MKDKRWALLFLGQIGTATVCALGELDHWVGECDWSKKSLPSLLDRLHLVRPILYLHDLIFKFIMYGLSAQMITTAITIGSNGNVVLSSGATYGILVAILVFHGVVCSAATRILARLNLAYVVINGESPSHTPVFLLTFPYSISSSWNDYFSYHSFICLFKTSGRKGLGEHCLHFA